MVSKSRSAVMIGVWLLAVGCGGSSITAETVAQPQSEIRAAEEAGANSVPKASLHLKMAKDQMTAGNKLAEDGHDDQASRAFARAKADAQLAVLLARYATLSAKSKEAVDRANALSSAPPGASVP
jgi:hypothetical protein